MNGLPLLPVTYCGPIDYYIILARNPEVLLEYCETYPKQTFRNRCTIYSANGPLDLVIPVIHSENRSISEVRPDYSVHWQKQHWNALAAAYGRSPFFEFYRDELQPFFSEQYTYLFNFNANLCQKLCQLLELDTRFAITDDFWRDTSETDYRSLFKPSKFPQLFHQEYYIQVFAEKHGFISNLSILDLLFNEGPAASDYLRSHETLKIL